jgi:SOS-response transcriptional repressor LexA
MIDPSDARTAKAQDGDIVWAEVRTDNGTDWFCKRYYRRGDQVELRPNVGESLYFPSSAVRVLGVVFAAWHPLDEVMSRWSPLAQRAGKPLRARRRR